MERHVTGMAKSSGTPTAGVNSVVYDEKGDGKSTARFE